MPYKDRNARLQYCQEYRQKHREQFKVYCKQYQRTHKTENAQRHKTYAENHQAEIKQYQQQYRLNHKTELAKYHKAYYEAHKSRLTKHANHATMMLSVVGGNNMTQKLVSIWKCLRCGHEWQARIETKPVRCPKCQSPYWDKERQR